MKNVLEELGWQLVRVVVTELRESTFFAELHLTANGQTHVVSARPSDAIALAARTGTTIFADESVLDEAAYPPEDEVAEEVQDEVVEQFKEFIDSVNPEDFAS
jgi:bifunctional DNase/RNase